MSKIDPKYVHELYQKHELTPCRCVFGPTKNNQCCALGVIAFDKSFVYPNVISKLDEEYGDEFSRYFSFGFDGAGVNVKDPYYSVHEAYLNGRAVGEYLLQFYQF